MASGILVLYTSSPVSLNLQCHLWLGEREASDLLGYVTNRRGVSRDPSGEGGALKGRFSTPRSTTPKKLPVRLSRSGDDGALETGRSLCLSASTRGLMDGLSRRLSATVSVDDSQVGGRSSHGTATVGEWTKIGDCKFSKEVKVGSVTWQAGDRDM